MSLGRHTIGGDSLYIYDSIWWNSPIHKQRHTHNGSQQVKKTFWFLFHFTTTRNVRTKTQRRAEQFFVLFKLSHAIIIYRLHRERWRRGGALSETTRQSVVESKWRDRALANSTRENNKNDRKKKRNTQTKSEHDHFPSMDKNQNNKLNIKKEWGTHISHHWETDWNDLETKNCFFPFYHS